MASSLHTVASIWREAVRDFSSEIAVLHFEKVLIVNRAVSQIVGALYPVYATYYRKVLYGNLSGASGTFYSNQLTLPTLVHIPTLEQAIHVRSTSYPLIPIQRLDNAAFQSWRPAALYNRNQIVYTIMDGRTLYFLQGSGILAIGGVTVEYPGIPQPVSSETTFLDIPDSMDVELIILKVRAILHLRNNVPAMDIQNELARALRTEYEKIGIKLSKETTDKKIAQLNET